MITRILAMVQRSRADTPQTLRVLVTKGIAPRAPSIKMLVVAFAGATSSAGGLVGGETGCWRAVGGRGVGVGAGRVSRLV